MKRKTIRSHRDFFVSQKSFKAMAECFVVKAKAAKISGDARYGLIVSKRDFKLAVHRNRAKRLMRDWIAFNEDLMSPELDYVFIAYSQVLDCGREVGRKSMADALVKIAELNENAKQSQ